jgi:cytochrome c
MNTTQRLLAAIAMTGAAANANASSELAKAKSCTACHAAATKLVGPSFKDISAKYEKDSTASEGLAKKIKTGTLSLREQRVS